MSRSATSPNLGGPLVTSSRGDVVREIAGLWWLWLVAGVAWIVASFVVLQFDAASITTIGVIVGCMFILSGLQQFVLAGAAEHFRWLWAIFGVLFVVAGVICIANPKETFAGMADILGFLFLLVGVWWTIRAFLETEATSLWWLGLISGICMIVVAFWTSGQFFIEKAYTLLIFAGIWALLHGIGDIVRAFAIRSLRDPV